MLLTAYLINGQTVGVDLPSWNDSDLNGNPPFKAEATVSAGYADISSMENWSKNWVLDWSRCRDEFKPLFYAAAGQNLQNFANLPMDQKLLACTYFCIPYAMRLQLVSEAEDLASWNYLLEKTKESRTTCVEAMRKFTGSYIRTEALTLALTQQFFEDVATFVDWFNEANNPNLKQWINDEAPYVGVFAGKPYYSAGLQTGLMSVYNGNY
jgi:hypothetical protein